MPRRLHIERRSERAGRGNDLESRRKNALGDSGRDPLTGLKKQLSEEYEGQPEDRIDQAARHGLDRLADARVRASLGSSRDDTPQSTFAELPEVFTSLPLSGQPWVTDTG
jgi:hypothetical protein